MKVAIIGAGGPGRPGFAFMEELRHGGVEIVDFEGDSMSLPRGYPTTLPGSKPRNTGAARIKRDAKRRSRKRR